MKSTMARPADLKPRWWVVDAEKEILGRMASKVAQILMGKHRPTYTPHIDTGDFVIVINAGKVQVTGRKKEQRIYRYHTQRPGGLKETSMGALLKQNPERVIRLAIRRMLPKTVLGKKMLSKLKIYATSEHPHAAQQPTVLALGSGH